jgi:hypothetical protein
MQDFVLERKITVHIEADYRGSSPAMEMIAALRFRVRSKPVGFHVTHC